ncbi:hypothetical protein [Micromonospora sp. NPDC047730]
MSYGWRSWSRRPRLAAAIEAYRERPQALAVGPVTAPEPAVEPAGG